MEDDDPPADTGEITAGCLVSSAVARSRPATTTARTRSTALRGYLHGASMSPQPPSYCEIDEEAEDGFRPGSVVE